ncbi:MAG: diguanylate cyclase [Candidatus Methylomirabilales bacterium]
MTEERKAEAVAAGEQAPVVLVVDDDPGIIRMLQVTLQRRGFGVLTASSGREALEVVAREPVDLVLLDIMMPGLNGLEVTRALRARPEEERIPVIILTAKDTVRDKVAGLELGADDYMTKPFNGEELVARIRGQLRLAGMARAIRRQNRELASLNAVAVAAGQSLKVREILGATLERLAEVEGVAAGAVMVWEPEREILSLAAERGLSPALRAAWHEQPLATSPWAARLREPGPGLLEELAASPDPALRAEGGGPYGNHASVALTAKGRTLGLIHLLSRLPHRFGADEMRFLTAIGQQVGMALENAHLYQQKDEQVSQMRALYEVSSSITSTLELQEVLRALIERFLDLMKVDRCVVTLSDVTGTAGEVVMGYDGSKPMPWIHGIQITLDRHPEVRRALETKKALVIPEALQEPLLGGVRSLLAPLQVRSILVIPLLTKDKALGVIVLSSLREGRPFTQGDVEFCQILANQAAIAIENSRLFAETKRLASTDELTGLFNHRQFYLLLGQEVRRALRYGRNLSLIMLDIDYFKGYNDRYGHLAGDEALRQIARVLKTRSRDVDMVSRYGGEEFTIILPETELPQAAVQAERLRVAVEGHNFSRGAEGHLTVSLGAAALAEGMDRPEQLVHRAENGIY